MKCILCDVTVVTTKPYQEGVCDSCGQAYGYGEGFSIDLSAHQIELLRSQPRVITRVLTDDMKTKDGCA